MKEIGKEGKKGSERESGEKPEPLRKYVSW